MKWSDKLYVAFGLGIVLYLGLLFTPVVYGEGNLFVKLKQAVELFKTPLAIQLIPETPKLLLLLCGLYGFALLVYGSTRGNRRTGEEYGSAKWGNPKSLCRKYADRTFQKNRLLTQNVRISTTGRPIRINQMSLVLGGSGTGKSYFYAKPNLLQANTSYIVLDPAGELVAATGNFLEEEGYKVRVLDLAEPERSWHYNPFWYLRKEADILRLVKILFQATVPKDSKSSDPMWDNLAEILCIAYVALLYDFGSPEEKNMRTLMWISQEDTIEEDENGGVKENAIMAFFQMIEQREPEHLAVKAYKSATKGAAKTRLSVQATLQGRLEKFNLESVCRMTDYDELELARIGMEKTALFLVIPAEDTSMNFMISMLYGQLFPLLYETAKQSPGLKLPEPTHILMDEFSNVKVPDEFMTYLTTGRKHKISFSILIQSISQLEKMYPKSEYETLIGNCDQFLYLGSNEHKTQKLISEWMGKETIQVKTSNISKGRNGQYSENEQKIARNLLEPDEVDTQIGEEYAILKIRGNRFILDKKIDPKKHPNYARSADGAGTRFLYGNAQLDARIQETTEVREADLEINLNFLSKEKLETVVTLSLYDEE